MRVELRTTKKISCWTDSFSGKPAITPRYDYNQIVYRMALDDQRLFLPAPVYRLRDGRYLMREGVAAAPGYPGRAVHQGRLSRRDAHHGSYQRGHHLPHHGPLPR